MAWRESVRLLHPVELMGSTYEQRVEALSNALRNATDPVEHTAIFDAYLICMAHERGAGE